MHCPLPLATAVLLLGGGVAGCSTTSFDRGASRGAPAPPERAAPLAEGAELPREVPYGAFDGEGAGCADLTAYRASTDGTQYVVVTIDRGGLGLAPGETRTIDLGTAPGHVEVSVDVFASAVDAGGYCAVAPAGAAPPRARWLAEAGSLTIVVGAESPGDPAGTYRASARLERVHFTSPEGGIAVVVPRVEIADVLVGWSPG